MEEPKENKSEEEEKQSSEKKEKEPFIEGELIYNEEKGNQDMEKLFNDEEGTEYDTYVIPSFGPQQREFEPLTIRCTDKEQEMFELSCDEIDWMSHWADYLDMSTDYDEVHDRIMLSGDEHAIESYRLGSGIRILRQDPFETLISFIISQNNNIPRIRKNIESLCERYGKVIEGSEELLKLYGAEEESCMHAFPPAEALASADEEELAAMKLGYRCAYIKASAAEYAECGCPGCREELLAFHGIGPKVANCIMLFGLRDTAAFPVDTWVKQIMNDMYGFEMNDTKGMQAFAQEKFGSLAGYAQQYLFYYYRDRKI